MGVDLILVAIRAGDHVGTSYMLSFDYAPALLKGIIEHFWNGKAGTAPKLERQPNEKINFIGHRYLIDLLLDRGMLGRGAAISLFLFPLLLPAMILLLRTLRRRQF